MYLFPANNPNLLWQGPSPSTFLSASQMWNYFLNDKNYLNNGILNSGRTIHHINYPSIDMGPPDPIYNLPNPLTRYRYGIETYTCDYIIVQDNGGGTN